MPARIKSGDQVIIIGGKDRGKRGKVLRIEPGKDRLYVEGLNMIKRHQRPRQVAGAQRAEQVGGVIEREGPEIVIIGKQAIDDDCNQTGQMLAALLGWPQATFASKLKISDGHAEVTREVDGGLETVAIKLPAVITTDLRLNEPRYASLPNIMRAKKKPIVTTTPDALGVDVTPHLVVLKVEEPPKRQGGHKVGSVAELVDKLKTEARVI